VFGVLAGGAKFKPVSHSKQLCHVLWVNQSTIIVMKLL